MMRRFFTLVLVMAMALFIASSATSPNLAQGRFGNTQGVPSVDRANFQAITSSGPLSMIEEMRSAFDDLKAADEEKSKGDAKKDAPDPQERQLLVDRIMKSYKSLLSLQESSIEVLSVDKDERWTNIWEHARGLFALNVRRGSDLEKAWLETFKDASEVAFDNAKESMSVTELLSVPTRFALSPSARHAAKTAGDLSFEAGRLDEALSAYRSYIELAPFQTLPKNELIGVSLQGFYAARLLGWNLLESRFEAICEEHAKTEFMIGEETKTVSAVLKQFKKEHKSFDALDTSLDDAGYSLPIATPAGQGAAQEPMSISESAWPMLRLESLASKIAFPRVLRYNRVEVSPILPTLTPTSILINNGEKLDAYDFYTGQRIWGRSVSLKASSDAFHMQEQDPNLMLTAIRWKDLAIATLENPLSRATHSPRYKSGGWRSVTSSIPIVRRALVAVDHGSGRERWKLGGQYSLNSEQQDATELEKQVATMSFFSMTVVGDKIYGVATERRNESQLFLVEIDAQSGKPSWSLLLGSGQGESNMFGNPLREAMPGIPLVTEGMLYLVSNLGAVIAVDLAAQRVQWVSRYTADPRPYTRVPEPAYRRTHFANGAPSIYRRMDGSLMLLAAPTDSGIITAYDLSDGTIEWEVEVEKPLKSLPNYLGSKGDYQPTVFAGVHGEFAYVTFDDQLYRIKASAGDVEGSTRISIRSGRSSSKNPLQGRPAIAGDHLYWPGRFGLVKLSLKGKDLPRGPFKAVDGRFGNLAIGRGALVSVHGLQYTSPNNYLDVRFDRKVLLQAAEAAAKESPEDARVLLRLVQLASQLGKASGYTEAKFEGLLRKVIELSKNDPTLNDVGDAASRELFDRVMKNAARALRNEEFKRFEALLNEARDFASNESQVMTIFLYEEQYTLDHLDNQGSQDFYRRWSETKDKAELTLRGVRVPIQVYAQWNLASYLRDAGQFAEALSVYDLVVEWGTKNASGYTLLIRCREDIAEVYKEHPDAYAGLSKRASDRLKSAQALTGPARTRSLLSIIERWRFAGVFYETIDLLVEDGKQDKSFSLVSARILGQLRTKANDLSKAKALVKILELHHERGEDVAALQAASLLTRFDPKMTVQFQASDTTLEALLAKLGLGFDALSAKDDGAEMRLPFLASHEWKKKVQLSEVYRTEGGAKELRLTSKVRGAKAYTFARVRQGPYELACIESKSGLVLWQSVGVTATLGITKVHSRFVVGDSQKVVALDEADGSELWSFSPRAQIRALDVIGKVAIVAYEQRRDGSPRVTISAININDGKTIWTQEYGRVVTTKRLMHGRWIYLFESHRGQTPKIHKIDAISGETIMSAETPFIVRRTSPSAFSESGAIVLRAIDAKSRNSFIYVLDAETLGVRRKVGPTRNSPAIYMHQDKMFLVNSYGAVAAFNISSGESLWTANQRPGSARLRSARILDEKLVLVWDASSQTKEVWATVYGLDGKVLHHKAIWKPSAKEDIYRVEVADFEVNKGVVIALRESYRFTEKAPDGRDIVRKKNKPIIALTLNLQDYKAQAIEMFKDAETQLYSFPLEELAIPTPHGLMLSDGVENLAFYPTKSD